MAKRSPGRPVDYNDPDRPLTIKQDRFARNYATTGNGTQSAINAGYGIPGAAVTAARMLIKPKISKAIAIYRKRTAERLDVSREKILNDAAHDAEAASVNGDYAAANSARALISRIQGYIVDRSVNVSVDLTSQHLQALKDMMVGNAGSPYPSIPLPSHQLDQHQRLDQYSTNQQQDTSQPHSQQSLTQPNSTDCPPSSPASNSAHVPASASTDDDVDVDHPGLALDGVVLEPDGDG